MMFTKLLRLTLVEKEMTAKELATKIGTTQQNLSAKMKRDNFSEKEMRQIADALGLDLEIVMKKKTSENPPNWRVFDEKIFFPRPKKIFRNFFVPPWGSVLGVKIPFSRIIKNV